MIERSRSKRRVASWAAVGALACSVAASPARAADAPMTPDSPPAPSHLGFGDPPSQSLWWAEIGYRGNFVTKPGFNPFSDDDYLGQFSATASRTLVVRGPFSFAVGLGWDYGKSSSTARGDVTSLEMQRLLAPLEGRLHFGRWGYALVRAEPGVAVENASLTDANASSPLTKSRWLFAADLSGGYAFPVVPRTGPSRSAASIWLQVDAGYGWVVAQSLDLSADTSATAVAIAQPIHLGTLEMSGAFIRTGLALGF